MRTLRLTIAYDGTSYVGWQRQLNGTSVQQVVEEAFGPLFVHAAGRPIVYGASRTDAGAHAIGQVASIRVPFETPAEAVHRALNVRLPPDVRVLAVADAPAGFHAQFDARAKSYRYRIVTAPILLPFDRFYAWHVPHRLDLGAMREAATLLVGRHDFVSFQGRGSAVVDTMRTVWSLAIEERPGELHIEITGDGFLRHMVRAIAGTLVTIGSGTRRPGWMAEIVAARTRQAGGATAPAQGLVLLDVHYGEGVRPGT
jgi:tRNA pseudouridine38-40 synthase